MRTNMSAEYAASIFRVELVACVVVSLYGHVIASETHVIFRP